MSNFEKKKKITCGGALIAYNCYVKKKVKTEDAVRIYNVNDDFLKLGI